MKVAKVVIRQGGPARLCDSTLPSIRQVDSRLPNTPSSQPTPSRTGLCSRLLRRPHLVRVSDPRQTRPGPDRLSRTKGPRQTDPDGSGRCRSASV